MNRKTFWGALMVQAMLALPCVTHAEPAADARALLAKANAEIAKKGLDAAVIEFNSNRDKWVAEKTYVYVTDFSGLVLAHAQNEKLVGKNVIEIKDAGGKQFVKEAIAAAQAKPETEIRVRWQNPATRKIDESTLIVVKVPGKDAYLGVPYFN